MLPIIYSIWGCVPEFAKDCQDMTNSSSTYFSIIVSQNKEWLGESSEGEAFGTLTKDYEVVDDMQHASEILTTIVSERIIQLMAGK